MKEREELYTNEIEQIDENVSFNSEEYNVIEMYNEKMEEFKVEEFQPQSFVENESKASNKKATLDTKKLDQIRDKIVHSTSLGTVGSTVLVGAVGAVVVLSPIFEAQATDFGIIDLINYRVEARVIDDTNLVKDLYLYLDEDLDEEYNCNIINLETNETITLDKSLDYVMFSNLTLDSYSFELQIVDANNEVIDTKEILVDTISSHGYINESSSEYMITYNFDETCNLYYMPTFDIEDESLYTEIELLTLDEATNEQSKLEYEVVNNNGILCIEDIKEEVFDIKTNSYVVENGNTYSINTSSLGNVMPYNVDISATIDYENLTINCENIITSDLVIYASYKIIDESTGDEIDDLEMFNIDMDEMNTNKTKDLTLERVKDDIEVAVLGVTKYNEVVLDISYKGTLEREFVEELTLAQETVSSVTFEYMEALNETYINTQDKIPTRLYFDGFIREDNVATLNIYDTTGTLVTSVDNITDFDTPIEVYDLDTTITYKFELVIKDLDGNTLVSDSHEAGVEIPSEYLDVTVNTSSPNPGDAYLTFNEDGTFNAYIPMTNFSAEDPNVYYQIDLIYESEVVHTLISRDTIAVFEDLNRDMYYGLRYGTVYKDGLNYYAIKDSTVPSGGIELNIEEYGNRHIVYCYPEQLENKILTFELSPYKISNKDMKAMVILDDTTELEIIIKYEDIVYDEYGDPSFTLDLTEYTFEEANIEIEAFMSPQYGLGDTVKENLSEIKGSEYDVCVFGDIISPLE